MKKKYDNKTAVPKDLVAHYTPADPADPAGVHVLKLEDDDEETVSADELKSFRQRNILLQKTLADVEGRYKALNEQAKRFEGLDPDAARKGVELIQSQQSDEDRKLLASGKLDEVLERRTGTMKSHYENALKSKDQTLAELQTRFSELEGRWSNQMVSSALSDAIEATGVRLRKGARTDVENRLRHVFKVESGKLQAYDDEGPKFSKNGKPYGVNDFIYDLTENTDYLFESTGGGGGASQTTGRSAPKSQTGVIVDRNDVDALGRNIEALKSGKIRLT